MQRELEQMLEHAKSVIPDLREMRVTLEYNPECVHDEPGLVIWAQRDEPRGDPAADKTDQAFGGWMVRTFPPEVCIHVVLISVFGDMDGWQGFP